MLINHRHFQVGRCVNLESYDIFLQFGKTDNQSGSWSRDSCGKHMFRQVSWCGNNRLTLETFTSKFLGDVLWNSFRSTRALRFQKLSFIVFLNHDSSWLHIFILLLKCFFISVRLFSIINTFLNYLLTY